MYICSDCGNEFLTWKGQCDFCKAWNTLKEFKESKTSGKGVRGEAQNLESLTPDQKASGEARISTDSGEFNTVLGGGLVQGSIVLLSGEPGIGKSTLALQIGKWIKDSIIYISGEETVSQISARAGRLGVSGNHVQILSENNLENIIRTLESSQPKVVILDSISVMYSNEINGTAGSIGQVRSISEKIIEYGKKNNITFIIIGHVTKDGSLAGPKTLEHMVDTVLYFEGDKFDNLRILRSLKNRFGSSLEIGLYTMNETGLHDIVNPGLELISDEQDTIGSALSMTMEGTRPLVVETESLTTYTKFGYPKRSTRGIIASKLDLIIAVLGKYTPVKLENYDVYANISRGMSFSEPGLDLAIAASIISSKKNTAITRSSIFIGEISLTGKIKNILFLQRRVKQALKLGFEHIYIPKNTENLSKLLDTKSPSQLIELSNISELISYI